MGDTKWLKQTIAHGFALLVVLKLKNAPAEDTIKKTMEAWYQVLTYKRHWVQEEDQERFEEAFMRLAQECEWFPTPKELLAMLPRKFPKALPQIEHKVDPKVTERNIKRLKAILRGSYVPVK